MISLRILLKHPFLDLLQFELLGIFVLEFYCFCELAKNEKEPLLKCQNFLSYRLHFYNLQLQPQVRLHRR